MEVRSYYMLGIVKPYSVGRFPETYAEKIG